MFCMKIFFIENSFFIFKQSACFFALKSYFIVNSLIAKPERVALSKMGTSIFGFVKGIIIIKTPS